MGYTDEKQLSYQEQPARAIRAMKGKPFPMHEDDDMVGNLPEKIPERFKEK